MTITLTLLLTYYYDYVHALITIDQSENVHESYKIFIAKLVYDTNICLKNITNTKNEYSSSLL